MVVVRVSDCFHYVRYLGWEADQTWRAEEVMLTRRLRFALRAVEVYFLKNWTLFHEARGRDEKRAGMKRREYQ